MKRSPNNTLTIGELAKAGDVPTSTIRFYERRGLLKPDMRSAGNYRSYTAHSAERLKFIRSAQASGFALSDIEEMLSLTVAEGSPCRDVAALVERRLADVRARIRELKRVEKMLAMSLATLCKSGADLCDEIKRMKENRPTLHQASPRRA